jgi:hypothetical protein
VFWILLFFPDIPFLISCFFLDPTYERKHGILIYLYELGLLCLLWWSPVTSIFLQMNNFLLAYGWLILTVYMYRICVIHLPFHAHSWTSEIWEMVFFQFCMLGILCLEIVVIYQVPSIIMNYEQWTVTFLLFLQHFTVIEPALATIKSCRTN